jgi:hypothetical protein
MTLSLISGSVVAVQVTGLTPIYALAYSVVLGDFLLCCVVSLDYECFVEALQFSPAIANT